MGLGDWVRATAGLEAAVVVVMELEVSLGQAGALARRRWRTFLRSRTGRLLSLTTPDTSLGCATGVRSNQTRDRMYCSLTNRVSPEGTNIHAQFLRTFKSSSIGRKLSPATIIFRSYIWHPAHRFNLQ